MWVHCAEDHQLVEPTFLEMVNSLLSGGEVPGLFTPEELAKVSTSCACALIMCCHFVSY